MKNKILAATLLFTPLFLLAEPHVLYVGPLGSDTATGADSTTPLKTINRAVAIMNAYEDINEVGGTVYLLDGTYADEKPADDAIPGVDDTLIANSAVVLANAIEVIGLNKDPSKVTVMRTSTNGTFRLFCLNHADAAVRHVTVKSGALTEGQPGGGFYIDANGGTVEHCVVDSCQNGGNNSVGAGGIYMTTGHVTRTTVKNCRVTNMRCYGAGLYAKGGLIDNCLITECKTSHHSSSCNGNAAVCLTGTAKMINCTVTKNTACLVTGIWIGSTQAQAINCAVYGNLLCTSTHSDGCTRFSGCFANTGVGTVTLTPAQSKTMTGVYASCAAEDYPSGSAGCVTLTESPFVDYEGGDYSVPEVSTILNAGDGDLARANSDQALDLAGSARYSGTEVDIGCYERKEAFTVTGLADKSRLVLPQDNPVSFTAVSAGASGSSTVTYTWDFGDGTTTNVTEASVTHEYAAAGSYAVTVTGRDGDVTSTYSLGSINCYAISCSAEAAATTVVTNVPVLFSITAVSAADPVTYTWDFGDGTPSVTTTEMSVSHAYAALGSYSVTVCAVSDALGSYDCTLETPMTAIPRDLYVAPNAVSPRAPYESWAAAANSIRTALDQAVDGCVIHLAAGSYEKDKGANVTVGKAVTVVGEGETPSDVIIPGYNSDNGGSRNMSVTAEGALVCNLTLWGGFCGSSPGGGNLYLSAGTVSNCVLSTGRTRNYGAESGGAKVTGGLLTHCVITNSYNGNRGDGIALVQTAGRVSNCLIVDNKNSWDSSRNAINLVYVGGGVIDNCTITGCRIMYNTKEGKYEKTDSAVKVASAAKAYNLAISDISYVGYSSNENAVVSYALKTPSRWAGTAESFINCVTDDATPINATCAVSTTDEMYADYASGNLLPGRALRNKSVAVDGYDFPSADLAGNPRLVGSKVDIGCYEGAASALVIIIR